MPNIVKCFFDVKKAATTHSPLLKLSVMVIGRLSFSEQVVIGRLSISET